MARSKPWLKLWTSWRAEPDIIPLTVAEKGCWILLYILAHECADEGRIVSESGELLPREMILQMLFIKGINDIRSFDSMIDKMMDKGYLHQEEGEPLTITNYAKEQNPTTGTGIKGTREALAERQRRWRDRQKDKKREPEKNVDKDKIKIQSASVTVSVTDVGKSASTVTDNPSKDDSVTRDSRAKIAKRAIAEDITVTDVPLPNWIDIIAWNAWLEVRKKKKAVPTPRAIELAVSTLSKLKEEGQNPTDVINQSVLNNWTGLFPIKRGSQRASATHKDFSQDW